MHRIMSLRLTVMEDNLEYNVDDAVTVTVCSFAECRILVPLLAHFTIMRWQYTFLRWNSSMCQDNSYLFAFLLTFSSSGCCCCCCCCCRVWFLSVYFRSMWCLCLTPLVNAKMQLAQDVHSFARHLRAAPQAAIRGSSGDAASTSIGWSFFPRQTWRDNSCRYK